jgi:hypothetical protein
MANIRHKQLRLVVYPNDHLPVLMTITGKPKVAEIAAALMGTAQHLGALRTIWSDLHD